MKSIRHGRNARDPLLHIEADGVLVNIRVGLTDNEGHHVTNVSISPDDKSRGGDGEGFYWYQDGARIIRLNPGEEPPVPPVGVGRPGKVYADPTTGEWVGEYETLVVDEVSRQTEWFDTEAEARRFARTGVRVPERGMNGVNVPDYGGRSVNENATRAAQSVIEQALTRHDGQRGLNPEWDVQTSVYDKKVGRVEQYAIALNGPTEWLCFVFTEDGELDHAYLRYSSAGDPAVIHFGQFDGEDLYLQVRAFRSSER